MIFERRPHRVSRAMNTIIEQAYKCNVDFQGNKKCWRTAYADAHATLGSLDNEVTTESGQITTEIR